MTDMNILLLNAGSSSLHAHEDVTMLREVIQVLDARPVAV
jgi:hypothetical protein